MHILVTLINEIDKIRANREPRRCWERKRDVDNIDLELARFGSCWRGRDDIDLELDLVLLWGKSFGRLDVGREMDLYLSTKLVLIGYKMWGRWGN